MRDNVTIAYRGAKYELGRGSTFFGIWAAGATLSQPLQWWPDTPEGWAAAWSRFTEIEAPGTIVPVGRGAASARLGGVPGGESPLAAGQGGIPAGPRAAGTSLGRPVAAGLLAAGVVLGVVGLFPGYLAGDSLANQPPELVPHVIYLAGWTVSAVLIAMGGTRLRLGALLGAGLSLVTFGLYFADAGTAMAGGLHLADAGLVLGIAGWLACAAGSAIAVLLPAAARPGSLRPGSLGTGGNPRPLGRPRGAQIAAAILLVLAGFGAAIAFAPSWDSFTLRTTVGQSQSLTAGNAFANPGPVIAGDVAVMVALGAVVIAAALWRPVRHGALLLIGATIPMVAQAISALIGASEAATPQQFGISAAQAQRLGLTISSGLTPTFWIYCALVLVLVVSCAWMLLTPREFAGVTAGPYPGTQPGDDLWRTAQPDPDDGLWATAAGADDDVPDATPTEPDPGAWHVPPADAFDLAGAAPADPGSTPGPADTAAPDPGSTPGPADTAVPDPGTPADDRTEPAAAVNLPPRSAE
ncbi:MAG TPA: hypothetical protein VIX15_03540 [Streptosporangiaceae bacterium]